MRRKTAQYRIADVKALPPEGSGEGIVEAVVAVFGNVDLVGDRIVKGAFAKSLERWKASGDPVPLIFDHQWQNLDAHAGEVLEAAELEPGDERLPDSIKDLGGLWIKAVLDLEDDFARRLFNKLKRRRIREWSFAYDVVDEREAKDANELVELDLIEVGPTLKGANPETQLLSVKSDPHAKAYVELAGSLEERAHAIGLAVRAWIAEAFPSGDGDEPARVYGYVEATFSDRVVVGVEDFRDPESTMMKQYEIPYAVDDDGAVALGVPTEVEIVGTVAPKSRSLKAGRALSAKNESKIRDALSLLSDVLKDVEKQDDGGKSLGPSEGTMTPEDLRLLVDIHAHDVAS